MNYTFSQPFSTTTLRELSEIDAVADDLIAFMISDLYPIPGSFSQISHPSLTVSSVSDLLTRCGIEGECMGLEGGRSATIMEDATVASNTTQNLTHIKDCWLSKFDFQVCFSPNMCLRLRQTSVLRTYEPKRSEEIMPLWDIDWSNDEIILPCYVLQTLGSSVRLATIEGGRNATCPNEDVLGAVVAGIFKRKPSQIPHFIAVMSTLLRAGNDVEFDEGEWKDVGILEGAPSGLGETDEYMGVAALYRWCYWSLEDMIEGVEDRLQGDEEADRSLPVGHTSEKDGSQKESSSYGSGVSSISGLTEFHDRAMLLLKLGGEGVRRAAEVMRDYGRLRDLAALSQLLCDYLTARDECEQIFADDDVSVCDTSKAGEDDGVLNDDVYEDVLYVVGITLEECLKSICSHRKQVRDLNDGSGAVHEPSHIQLPEELLRLCACKGVSQSIVLEAFEKAVASAENDCLLFSGDLQLCLSAVQS